MSLTPDEASARASFLLNLLSAEFKTTRAVLAAVPDGKAEYRPDEDSMSARQLAAHIAFAELFFMEGVAQGVLGKPDSSGVEKLPTGDILKRYEEEFPQKLEALRALSPEDLAAPITFMERWTQERVGFLEFAVKHSIHHRGQLSAYLRPMGAKVPSIYGPSKDTRAALEAKLAKRAESAVSPS